jgi:ribosomal protein S18 acetylase RimI-like enzyme
MPTIETLTPVQVQRYIPQLVALLQDAVEDGASVGFILPLYDADAREYWLKLLPDITQGTRILLAAMDGERVAGSVQLELAQKPNGVHRAEVQKLLVHRDYRRQGLGEALMVAIEAAAREARRSLLVLDTAGEAAKRLYRRLEWVEAGSIPQFAMSTAGVLEATVIFYKSL